MEDLAKASTDLVSMNDWLPRYFSRKFELIIPSWNDQISDLSWSYPKVN